MDVSKDYAIIKYNNGSEEKISDTVVVEYELSIFLNGEKYKKVICSPTSLKELIVGMLLTEKIIHSMSDVIEIVINEPDRMGMVSLKTVYGNEINPVELVLFDNLDYKKLVSLFQQFVSSSKLFESTGGVHSCAISDGYVILYHQDDISRQNALDKAIGSCVLNNIVLRDKIMFTSCRISSEIMTKVINSGLKILMSKSAPTDVAIELAKQNGVTLIGFIRGDRMNIYERD